MQLGNSTGSFAALRLLDPRLARWIGRASDAERRAFAIACGRCALRYAVAGADAIGADLFLQLLNDAAHLEQEPAGRDVAELVHRIEERESAVGRQRAALRGAEAAATSWRVMQLGAAQFALRAFRVALSPDALMAAGRAALWAMLVVRDDGALLRLAGIPA